MKIKFFIVIFIISCFISWAESIDRWIMPKDGLKLRTGPDSSYDLIEICILRKSYFT